MNIRARFARCEWLKAPGNFTGSLPHVKGNRCRGDRGCMCPARFITLSCGVTAARTSFSTRPIGAYADGMRSEWLTVERVLALFGPTAGQARAAYAAFMKAPVDEGLWQLLRTGRDDDQRVLGDDNFVRSITTDGRGVAPSYQTLDELVRDACRRHGVCEADLAAPPSRDAWPRSPPWRDGSSAVPRGCAGASGGSEPAADDQ